MDDKTKEFDRTVSKISEKTGLSVPTVSELLKNYWFIEMSIDKPMRWVHSPQWALPGVIGVKDG